MVIVLLLRSAEKLHSCQDLLRCRYVLFYTSLLLVLNILVNWMVIVLLLRSAEKSHLCQMDGKSMKHPGLSGLSGPCYISGPGLFLGLRLLQSQDPRDFIVQPDPSKESRTSSHAGLAARQIL